MKLAAIIFVLAFVFAGCGQSVEVGRDVPTIPDPGELCDSLGGHYGWPDGAPAWVPRCHLPQRCVELRVNGFACQ